MFGAEKSAVGGGGLGLLARLGFASAGALALLAIGAPPAQAAFPGANGRIAFGSDGTIYSINPDGSGRVELTRGSAATWSADGSQIAFVRDDSSGVAHVWTMDANGDNQRRITVGRDPAWSPDGARLAYVAPDPAVEGNLAIHVIGADGNNPNVLAAPPCPSGQCNDTAPTYHSPAWSPDGREIAFRQIFHDLSNLRLVNADGTDQREVSPGDGPPDWSPDGAKVAAWVDPCLGECPERVGLYEIDPLAAWPALSRFFGNLGYADSFEGGERSDPAWSPDGRMIVFHAGNGDLSLLRLSDGSVSVITDQAGRPIVGGSPSWQPAQLPTTKAQCKRGGWRSYPGFKNSGACVSFVESGK